MIDAITYEYMIDRLSGDKYPCKNIGILFCNPKNKFVKEQIFDNINQFHHASSEYIDIYLPGYGAYWNEKYEDKEVACVVDGVEWYYSAKEFRNFVNKLQENSKWIYKGECEVLFFEYINCKLDFKNSISIWLDKAVKDEDIYSVSNEFEKIFRLFKSGKSLNDIYDSICISASFETLEEYCIEKTALLGRLYKNVKFAVTRDLNK